MTDLFELFESNPLNVSALLMRFIVGESSELVLKYIRGFHNIIWFLSYFRELYAGEFTLKP